MLVESASDDLLRQPKPTNTIWSSGFGYGSASLTSLETEKSSGGFEAIRRMNPDFVDLLRGFIAADVRFLVVGSKG